MNTSLVQNVPGRAEMIELLRQRAAAGASAGQRTTSVFPPSCILPPPY